MSDMPPEGDPGFSSAADRIDELLAEGILDEPPHPGIRACFKRFHILQWLGEGGIAVVLLAHDPQARRYVALKLLRPELNQEKDYIDRFRREAELLQKITATHHEHILPVSEIAAPEEPPYLVTPFIEGGSLAERIRRQGPLDDSTALRIAIDVGRALVAAHRLVIYHRDIKPENVLLDSGDRALLADFNLAFDGAVVGSIEVDATRIAGTAPYLAPEVASGDQQGDARSDVYGVGCLLYTMLTGQPPYSGATNREVLNQISAGKSPAPLRQLNRRIGRDLTRVVEKAMHRERQDRYQEMSLFVQDLERIARGAEPALDRAGHHGQSPLRAAVWVVAAALFAACGVALWTAWPPGANVSHNEAPLQPHYDERADQERRAIESQTNRELSPAAEALDRHPVEREQEAIVPPVELEAAVHRNPELSSTDPGAAPNVTTNYPARAKQEPVEDVVGTPPEDQEISPEKVQNYLEEDFRSVTLGGLPENWDGEDGISVQSLHGRRVLACTRQGTSKVTTPKIQLNGDFIAELELSMYFMQDNVTLTLNGPDGDPDLHLTFQRVPPGSLGSSTATVVLDEIQSRTTFKPWTIGGRCSQIQLERNDDTFLVRVGGNVFLAEKLERFKGKRFESISLELSSNVEPSKYTYYNNQVTQYNGYADHTDLFIGSLSVHTLSDDQAN